MKQIGLGSVALASRCRLLQAGIAGLLTAGMLAAASTADARTTRIQILSRTTAFGGFSFPGIGQYEAITGIATGEVSPNDPKNAVITDIALAPRLPDGNVQYQHNFYILKPVDLSKGNHEMMYEPPQENLPGAKPYSRRRERPRSFDGSSLSGRGRKLVPLVARFHDRVERLGE
jgi:hypothetical protein